MLTGSRVVIPCMKQPGRFFYDLLCYFPCSTIEILTQEARLAVNWGKHPLFLVVGVPGSLTTGSIPTPWLMGW